MAGLQTRIGELLAGSLEGRIAAFLLEAPDPAGVTISQARLGDLLGARRTSVNRVFRLPLWTWRAGWLVRARELLAKHALGMGEMRLSGKVPSGQIGILMPQRMYLIEDSTAVLDGVDLGRPRSGRRQPAHR